MVPVVAAPVGNKWHTFGEMKITTQAPKRPLMGFSSKSVNNLLIIVSKGEITWLAY
jgi:hypothetical protein